jgi:hypothetical protein
MCCFFFCRSLVSVFPGMLFRYFLNYFEMVPVAPVLMNITFNLTFCVHCISILRSLYFQILPHSFLVRFLSWNCSSASRIFHIAWNLKIHCHVNNIPPHVPILSQICFLHLRSSKGLSIPRRCVTFHLLW